MTTKDIKEVKAILKDLKKEKDTLYYKDKYILNWDANDLRCYIKEETKGMSIPKKLRFAKNLNERIKEEKRKLKK